MPAPDFSEAVARVWGSGSEPVGSAFLVGPRTLLTCAHVLAHARGGRSWRGPRRPLVPRPGWEVEVDFPQHDAGRDLQRLSARAVAVQPVDGLHGDICVLELLDDEPPTLGRLVLHPLDDLQGRTFRTFGYPADFEDGASAHGLLRGLVGASWLEAVTDEIAPGFSGAPVWADHLSGVVGMVVARHSSGRAYAVPVRSLLAAHPPLRDMALPPSPYRGLRAFEQEDARVFAGRDTLAGELAELADEHPVTVVHGPSGVGKTSLVRAGVLPRLSARGAATAAVRLHPRIALAAEIADALRIAGEPAPAQVREELARALAGPDTGTLPALLRPLGADRLAVVLDQLDEVLAADPAAAGALDAHVARLTRTPDGAPSPVRVLVTVRDTFRLAAHEATPTICAAWDAYGWAVNPPTPTELREMITAPLRTVRCLIDPELVGQIVDDARVGASALPLVQETLSALYEHQRSGRLTSAAYQEIGGVTGALKRRADDVVRRLESEAYAPGDVLVQLVRPDDTADGDARGRPPQDVRRVALREDLSDEQWQAAQDLATARLVVTSNGGTPSGPGTAELAHQVLIEMWPRLREWVAATRDFRVRQEAVRVALYRWRAAESGRDRRHALLGGTELRRASRWLRQYRETVRPHEREFIVQSRRRRAATLRASAAAVLAGVVVLAAIAAHLVRQSDRRAEQNAVAAAGSNLVAQAQQAENPLLALRLGIAGLRLRPDSAARAGLVSTLTTTHYEAALPGNPAQVSAVAYAPNGRLLATGASDGSLSLWDVARPRAARRLAAAAGCADGKYVDAVAFSPDGRTVAQLTHLKATCLWDVRDPARPRLLHRFGTYAQDLAFSPDGRTLAVGEGKAVALWDVRDPARPVRLSVSSGHLDIVYQLAYSADGRILASARDGVTLWDPTRPRHPVRLAAIRKPLYLDGLAIHPKGRLVVAAQYGGDLIAWDLRDPRRPKVAARWAGHNTTVDGMDFSPDGTLLATAGDDGSAVLWDMSDPGRPRKRATLTAGVPLRAVAFSPDGAHVATAATSGVTTVWRVRTAAEATVVSTLNTGTVALPRGGGVLAAAGRPSALYDLSDPAGPRRLATLDPGGTSAIAFSRDGRTVATVPGNAPLTLWDVGEPVRPRRVGAAADPKAARGSTQHLTFRPDGKLLAVVVSTNEGLGGRVDLWDTSDRRRPALLGSIDDARGDRRFRSAEFSPDGRLLAVGGLFEAAALYDVSDPARPIRRAALDAEPSAPPSTVGPPRFTTVAYGPGGGLVASGESTGDVVLWDVTAPGRPTVAQRLTGQSSEIRSVAFSPDGRLLASGSYDRTLVIWDVTDIKRPRRVFLQRDGDTYPTRVVFSPDGAALIAGYDWTTTTVLDISGLRDAVTDPVGLACALSGELIPQVWSRFVPDVPFRHTCEQ
ncbi:trypsin-like peptidase domain-containing protein [Streptomyces sp. NPDC050504]|uniref:nSTAND1 domain-containing NTPase n=1 Tax=Streptomyces sp. NPDC050504 TaxID=3365618 RepID=UPI0037BBD2E7